MALDDKAFRYFDPRTGKFEIETGEYEILVAASVSDADFATLLDRPIPKGSWTKHNVIGQFCTNCPIF